MWEVSNETPFAVAGSWTRDERGHQVWLTVIKASFEIDPDGKQTVMKKQAPINWAPAFGNGPDEMLDDLDFNIEKKRTDVLVAGHVHAPNRTSALETVARVKVADVDKILKVIGDRVFVPGSVSVRLSRPEPFTKLPITWRRAFGGADMEASKPNWDERNPIGTGFAVDPQRLIGKTAPNFEYPDAPYGDHRSGRPAGFGAVARHWIPRRKHAGTYGEMWQKTRDPLPPTDFSRAYYQCAPEDQQTKANLVGHEDVRLGGFTADGFLQFLLPRIEFDLTSEFQRRPDRKPEEARLHTLRIIPEERRFSMTWVAALPVPYDEEFLTNTIVRLRPSAPVSPALSRTGVWIPEKVEEAEDA
jgi:hypothetical protein